ncbi:MAG: hypothetical protein KDK00_05755 [Rhodobacteraceae bacterium]|nr:hypothetical protein [Paracoccaceae bacterium]
MLKSRLAFVLLALLFLPACVAQLPWAPDERLAAARYSSREPASITLMTVVANGSNSAGHAALLINGSQQVIYDPAGTWYHRDVPERADLLYGITPKMLQYYIDYHARDRFHVVMQTKQVPREVADNLIARAIAKGASMSAMCAQNTSALLAATPGFTGITANMWPRKGVEAMSRIPGVTERRIYQTDEGKDLKT